MTRIILNNGCKPDDVVEMEIDGLGRLSNTIVAEETDWSILENKNQNGSKRSET